MKIESAKRKGKSPDFEEGILIIDGEAIEESNTFVLGSGRYGSIYDIAAGKRLAKQRFKDFEQHFVEISLPLELEWCDVLNEVEIRFRDYKERNIRRLRFEFRIDFEQWSKPYSIAEFAEAVREATKERKDLGLKFFQDDDEFITNGFGLDCSFKSLTAVIEKEVTNWTERLRIIYESAVAALAKASRKNSVVTFFDFPLPVRSACEQYLLYFVQFLEDLGIKANAEIKEDARKVLFSVTPVDGPTALEQVRKALEVYLRLPGMPDFSAAASQYPNLAVQQLQGNILHLQSQLMLAKASLQAQEATIEALQFSNFQYRQLLSSEEKPKEQSEALIGDTVHVTKIEGKGVKIDLPLILRRLKRVFGVGRKRIE